jgi:cytidylate kinase
MTAQRLGYLYLDTGAMYRAMTLKALREGVNLDDADQLDRLARDTAISVHPDPAGTRIMLDGDDVTDRLRGIDVTRNASVVSAAPGVRRRMVELQRAVGAGGGIVAEGRDMGSVVFPQADVKIYLDADVHCRALRRKKEWEGQGRSVSLESVEADIVARDAYDSGRNHSPLVVPDGAVTVDTTDLTIEEQVEMVIDQVRKVLGEDFETAL